jgi:iron complex transport system substrate-binding protein
MRIVSLQPSLTDIAISLGAGGEIVGVSHLCSTPNGDSKQIVVTSATAVKASSAELSQLAGGLSALPIDLEALKAAQPDVILTSCVHEAPQTFSRSAENVLRTLLGKKVTICSVSISTFNQMIEGCGVVGSSLGRIREGHDLGSRIKAQLMDWGSNFYDRMKGKKVSVISSISPLTVAGLWIPDVVRLFSGKPQHDDAGEPDRSTTWDEVLSFRPDVMVIAPRGFSVSESVKTFKELVAVPQWDNIPAVKRGAVTFADGVNLFTPGPKFIQGAAVLVSAMAELDSGYITKRDEFYRLRFVELHRHRFM